MKQSSTAKHSRQGSYIPFSSNGKKEKKKQKNVSKIVHMETLVAEKVNRFPFAESSHQRRLPRELDRMQRNQNRSQWIMIARAVLRRQILASP